VALFDILGFGELVKNNDLAKVFETYKKYKGDFEENFHAINCLLERDVIRFQLFSDTFLIYTTGVRDDDFVALLVACEYLFIAAIENNLPIRGAITVGDLIIGDDVVFGKPIVDAYEMEQKQRWIGCWISDDCMRRVGDRAGHLERKSIVKYDIPLKNNKVEDGYVFNWVMSVPRMVMSEKRRNHFEVHEVMEKVDFAGGQSEKTDVKEKYDNMRKFMRSVLTDEYLTVYMRGVAYIQD